MATFFGGHDFDIIYKSTYQRAIWANYNKENTRICIDIYQAEFLKEEY